MVSFDHMLSCTKEKEESGGGKRAGVDTGM